MNDSRPHQPWFLVALGGIVLFVGLAFVALVLAQPPDVVNLGAGVCGSGPCAVPAVVTPVPTVHLVDRSDPRFAACRGDEAPVVAAFAMAAARDYGSHIPAIAGEVLALDASGSPAFVVVFDGAWSGATAGASAGPPSPSVPPGGWHDACVFIGSSPASGHLVIVGSVSLAGLNP